jgi:hypothetical protein
MVAAKRALIDFLVVIRADHVPADWVRAHPVPKLCPCIPMHAHADSIQRTRFCVS